MGAGVIVALIGGVLALVDRASPAPTAAPLPTTPNISVDVSTAAGGQELSSFLSRHSNQVVGLDIRCFEGDGEGASPCFTERSGIDLTSEPSDGDYAWMWLFTGEPCFGRADEGRDLDACQGEVLLWIDPRTDGSTASIGNIEGAGSVAVRGSWVVKSPFGVAFFGTTVEGHGLTPAR